ncbi:uncharacterized protein ANIA_11483 [Aspergillus nidulans FGSC A4]|uniref:Uncharacterized protein n=1 Tax=Emericella nidulans (strain FGSC A4 / ATCC 38163 / CBS 112.46 / NRRL 194 / M139) TaxID=227321 RepID=C8VG22_EMENI|nr:hypothetical protein [Aspergillus nidulans FGSC A4]CBF81617.1 TPA: hypothetical protein ANIA_11483 [Aspergillus nidulans FGSC A4]
MLGLGAREKLTEWESKWDVPGVDGKAKGEAELYHLVTTSDWQKPDEEGTHPPTLQAPAVPGQTSKLQRGD